MCWSTFGQSVNRRRERKRYCVRHGACQGKEHSANRHWEDDEYHVRQGQNQRKELVDASQNEGITDTIDKGDIPIKGRIGKRICNGGYDEHSEGEAVSDRLTPQPQVQVGKVDADENGQVMNGKYHGHCPDARELERVQRADQKDETSEPVRQLGNKVGDLRHDWVWFWLVLVLSV